jgi:hypothetical protein
MANVAAGTTWNLPNFFGALFTASPLKTPLLALAGGLNGAYQTNNFEFPVDQNYSIGSAAQPSITETASLTAPTAISYVRAQDKNVCQIIQEAVSISYNRLSNQGRVSGIATSGKTVEPVNEKDFQIMVALQKIARDMEYSILRGTYQIATSAAVASTTRGLNNAASTTVAGGSAQLTKAMINAVLKGMFDNGAQFQNPVFVVNSFQKQMISSIFGYAPMDRTVGGVNMKQIETDFGLISVMLDAFQDAAVVLVADAPFVKVVSQPVPSKGNLFYEELSKTGASEVGQIYGQLGLDHGPGFMHGVITGLATS